MAIEDTGLIIPSLDDRARRQREVFAEDASVFGGDFALAAQNRRPDVPRRAELVPARCKLVLAGACAGVSPKDDSESDYRVYPGVAGE